MGDAPLFSMKTFGNKLDEILADKAAEVRRLLPVKEKLRYAAAEREDFRPFATALGDGLRDQSEDEGYGSQSLAVIAEIKKASPSAGTIAHDFDPVAIAMAYAEAGADALSVLTDEKYFQGHLTYLAKIREQVALPILRKDFIIDEVQIYESVVAGADAILLIVAALEQEELLRLLDTAGNCQLDVLVEVHDLEEMDRAIDSGARLIGINNRNLRTFQVDLSTTERLSEEVGPDHILVSESGIFSGADTSRIRSWGADAVLVGEALMRAPDKIAKMTELKSGSSLA